MTHAVEVHDLTKTYGNTVALKQISFAAGKGELLGFIGPDGAGKTTLFRILATLLLPDSGTAMVEGFNVVAGYTSIRRIIGYMPGRFSLYQDLTVEENLRFFATIFGTTIRENYHLIKEIYQQIEPFKHRKAGKLSGGMKQKLALSCALIHKPHILFLDEPTTGVDAVSRQEFWEMLKRLREQGITILVSTPYMDEASLCDRVALIQNGSLMQINSPDAIVEQYPMALCSVSSGDTYRLIHDLEKLPLAHSVYAFGQSAHLAFVPGSLTHESILDYLHQHEHKQITLEPIKPGIEDCFMELAKREGYGMRDTGCGMRDTGCGMRDTGYGIRDNQ